MWNVQVYCVKPRLTAFIMLCGFSIALITQYIYMCVYIQIYLQMVYCTYIYMYLFEEWI